MDRADDGGAAAGSPDAGGAGLDSTDARDPAVDSTAAGTSAAAPAADSANAPSTHAPAGLLEAVRVYEDALMRNDLVELDRFFAPGDATMRGDASGLLVGHDRIRRFRQARGGTPHRRVVHTEVRTIDDDHALVITVGAPDRGGRGQQTQLWRRSAAGWAIDAAHVSAPQPAIDPSVWRIAGTPLVRGAEAGPLARARVAVKDLFAVEGFAVGGGVPEFLAEQRPAASTAPAVGALLAAGADVTGIARTDEFAYSIAGRNPHYGSPPNPAVPGGIPGGSSNGPASAVALGQADVGLGTDTGGSVRVPASYQGLWGLRTTHDAVDRAGLLPLAPSFDTVGWLTRDAATLRAAAETSLSAGDSAGRAAAIPPAPGSPSSEHHTVALVVCDALTGLADGDVAQAFIAATTHLEVERVELPDLDAIFEAFRTVQACEAWATHGSWIEAHPGALGDDIAARFRWASSFTEEDEDAARAAISHAREQLELALDGRVLLLPSTSSAAPQVDASAEENEATRAGTLRLTCVAGTLGAPALSVPVLEVDAGPVGLCLVGPRGGDFALIDLAERLFG